MMRKSRLLQSPTNRMARDHVNPRLKIQPRSQGDRHWVTLMRRSHLLQSPMIPMARDKVDPRFKKLGANLLNEQCWCWGRDIRRPQGNLLLAFGFERLRPPADVKGSSRYCIALRSGRNISLWGFGVLIEERVSAAYLGRFEFEPLLCAALGATRPCWAPSDLTPLRRPASTRELTLAGSLCSELLSFIGKYESWVAETVGIQYRQQTVNEFKNATYSAVEAKRLWPSLAKQVARYYGRQAARNRMI